MAKKMTAVEKAYSMFGTGAWVAETGKIRETRLIKELVEATEKAEERADQAEEVASRCKRFEWLYENEQEENASLNGEIALLRAKIDSFNDRLNAIATYTNTQRIN